MLDDNVYDVCKCKCNLLANMDSWPDDRCCLVVSVTQTG